MAKMYQCLLVIIQNADTYTVVPIRKEIPISYKTGVSNLAATEAHLSSAFFPASSPMEKPVPGARKIGD